MTRNYKKRKRFDGDNIVDDVPAKKRGKSVETPQSSSLWWLYFCYSASVLIDRDDPEQYHIAFFTIPNAYQGSDNPMANWKGIGWVTACDITFSFTAEMTHMVDTQ